MDFITGQIIASGVAVLIVLAIGIGLSATVKHLDLTPEQRLRTRNTVSYILVIVLCAFLLIVWAEELRSAAIIASAFAVAIVLSFKELLMCVAGWWVKTMGGAYRIGDRVQIGDIKGDVLDYGVLSTTLMEVGNSDGDKDLRSGTVITVPNSLMLSETVRNLTHSLGYSWRATDVYVQPEDDWQRAETLLLACAREEVEQYREPMSADLKSLEQALAFHPIQAEPRVLVSLCDDGRIRLTLRVGLPVYGLRSVQDRIVRKFLQQQKQ
jgi:small-conductance mechanosensitive channel